METTLRRERPRVAGALIAVGIAAVILLVSVFAARSFSTSTSTGGRVFVIEPRNGATVSSPVRIRMGAEDFKVEPAGPVASGRGHLHIMVDADCVPAGQVIPKDDRHLHYGKGQTEAELTLAPGTHRLCVQAANGAHVALDGSGMQRALTINVK